MVIKKVRVLSVAKVVGTMNVVVLVMSVGVLYCGSWFITPPLDESGLTTAGMLGSGILLASIPVVALYGVLGFVTGLLLGLLYNVVASVVGGIEIVTIDDKPLMPDLPTSSFTP